MHDKQQTQKHRPDTSKASSSTSPLSRIHVIYDYYVMSQMRRSKTETSGGYLFRQNDKQIEHCTLFYLDVCIAYFASDKVFN